MWELWHHRCKWRQIFKEYNFEDWPSQRFRENSFNGWEEPNKMADWLYTRLWEFRWEHLKTTSESFSFDSIVHDYNLGDIWVLSLPMFCFLNLCSVDLFHLAQTPLPWYRDPTLHSKMANSCNYPMLYFPVYYLSLLFIRELSIQFPLMSASMNRLQGKARLYISTDGVMSFVSTP